VTGIAGFSIETSGSGPDALLLHGGPAMGDYLAELAALLDGTVTSHRYTQRGVTPAPLEGPFTVDRHVPTPSPSWTAWNSTGRS
jgi:hypothetical protein